MTALKNLALSTATAMESANQECATVKTASSDKPVKLKAASTPALDTENVIMPLVPAMKASQLAIAQSER